MKKFVALLMKKKWPGMNGKMMTPTFFELYTTYIDFTHHCMPNSICVCILPHACWKSCERACYYKTIFGHVVGLDV